MQPLRRLRPVLAGQTDQKLKNILGHSAYVLEGMKRLLDIPSYRIKVTCGETVIEDEFMIGMVTNSKSVAGFQGLTPKDVQYDDGEFEVTLIKKPKNPKELQEIITAMLVSKYDTDYMFTFKASELVIESETEIPWTIDGEFGGQHSKVLIRNKKHALKIMVENEGDE